MKFSKSLLFVFVGLLVISVLAEGKKAKQSEKGKAEKVKAEKIKEKVVEK